MQVPVVTVVISKPVTVQTPVVNDSRATVKLEVAVAPEAKVCPDAFDPGLLKVIVWLEAKTCKVIVLAEIL